MELNRRWKQALAGCAMIVIASALMIWCLRQIDFAVFWRDLASASFLALSGAMGCIYLILIFNTWQWQLFLPKKNRISFQRMFRVIRVMLMMANVIPYGYVFSVYHLGQIERVGKTIAVSVITLDQIAEGFSKLAVFLLVSWLTPIPGWMKNGIQIAVVTVSVAYLTILFFAHRYREFEEKHPDELHTRWHQFSHFISKWAHHLHVMRDYRKTSLAILLALCMKASEVVAVYLVQVAFGIELPLWSSLFLVAAYNLSTMVPVTPGNLGIFEATAFVVYKYMGVPPTQALSLAIFNHLVYLVPLVVPGYWVAARSGIKLSRSVIKSPARG